MGHAETGILNWSAEWGEGGKAMFMMMLAVSYFVLGRGSEMFAYNGREFHKNFGVTRVDVCVCFFCGMYGTVASA